MKDKAPYSSVSDFFDIETVRCSCGSNFHFMNFMRDKEDNVVYASVMITPSGLWRRIKLVWAYLLGRYSDTWMQEFILPNPDLDNLMRFLEKQKSLR